MLLTRSTCSAGAAEPTPADGAAPETDSPEAGAAPVTVPTRRARWRAWRRQRPFAGGVLLMLGGIELFASSQLDFGRLHIHLGIEGLQALVIPAALIALGALVIATPAHRMLYGVLALAVAVYSIVGVNLGGFLIGFLLAAVGGILTVAWMPRSDGPEDDAAPRDASPEREGASDAEAGGEA